MTIEGYEGRFGGKMKPWALHKPFFPKVTLWLSKVMTLSQGHCLFNQWGKEATQFYFSGKGIAAKTWFQVPLRESLKLLPQAFYSLAGRYLSKLLHPSG